MKRLLILAAALSLAGYASGQEPAAINKADYATPKSGGAFTVPPGYLTIRDETTDRTTRAVLTFLGAGVTCADSVPNLATECTIPGSSGAVATDAIWDAAGDLVVGTGADTAAKLTKGADGKVLTMTAGAVGWASLPAAAGSVLLQASSPGTPDVGNFNITGIGTSTHDAAGATLTPGFFLSNTTAAALGAQQYSPSLKLCGQGWNSGGSDSETNCWQVLARPIQGSPSTVDLVFQASIAGAAYTQQMYMQSNGHLTLGNSGSTVGAISLLNATSGSILLEPATGALGGQIITVPAATGTMALLENPTFTLFKVGNGATGPGSFDVLEDSDNGTNYIRTIGQSDLSANRTYTLPDVGADGTYVITPASYPRCTTYTTCASIWEEFTSRGAAAGTTVPSPYGACFVFGSGTASGGKANTGTNSIAADGTAPGIAYMTTGSTATGSVAMWCGGDSSESKTIAMTIGTIFEVRVWLPVLSTDADQTELTAGFCDTAATSHCSNGFGFYLDSHPTGGDTHWGCYTVNGGTRTDAVSTTVGTAAAWHKLRGYITSGPTINLEVDGAALSCSGQTGADVPTSSTLTQFQATRLRAAVGCGANTTCTVGTDYAYFYNPGISR